MRHVVVVTRYRWAEQSTPPPPHETFMSEHEWISGVSVRWHSNELFRKFILPDMSPMSVDKVMRSSEEWTLS